MVYLSATNLHTKKCPHLGKYSVQTVPIEDRRKKRDKPMEDMNNIPLQPEEEDCDLEDYQALSVGCSGSNEMEFKTSCRRQSLVCTSVKSFPECVDTINDNLQHINVMEIGKKTT